jgi:UPF0716 protein FxsA
MFVLVMIGVPILEVLAFVEVARVIGWLPALGLLLATSVLGARLLRIEGRMAIERVSLAVSGRGAPGAAAIDGALGFLGAALLVLPGFVTDALGGLLLLGPTRRLARRWISGRYAARVMGFAARAARFSARERGARVADVDSTAFEDDLDELGRPNARRRLR